MTGIRRAHRNHSRSTRPLSQNLFPNALSQNGWMETEKWESGERPNDHVLGERWPPGAAEMSQATVSRAVADETQKATFEGARPLPAFCHSFISQGQGNNSNAGWLHVTSGRKKWPVRFRRPTAKSTSSFEQWGGGGERLPMADHRLTAIVR